TQTAVGRSNSILARGYVPASVGKKTEVESSASLVGDHSADADGVMAGGILVVCSVNLAQVGAAIQGPLTVRSIASRTPFGILVPVPAVHPVAIAAHGRLALERSGVAGTATRLPVFVAERAVTRVPLVERIVPPLVGYGRRARSSRRNFFVA